MTTDQILQIAVPVSTIGTSWMVTSKTRKWRLIGCIIGLLGTGLWFTMTYRAGQWGIFFMTFFYVVIYARGIYNHRTGKTKTQSDDMLPMLLGNVNRVKPKTAYKEFWAKAHDTKRA